MRMEECTIRLKRTLRVSRIPYDKKMFEMWRKLYEDSES